MHLGALGLFSVFAYFDSFLWLEIELMCTFCTCLFSGHMSLFLLGIYLQIEFLSLQAVNNPKELSKMCQFTLLPAMYEISSCPISLPIHSIAILSIFELFC
jgi:hypothetical protein